MTTPEQDRLRRLKVAGFTPLQATIILEAVEAAKQNSPRALMATETHRMMRQLKVLKFLVLTSVILTALILIAI